MRPVGGEGYGLLQQIDNKLDELIHHVTKPVQVAIHTVRHTTYILHVLRTSAPVECTYGITEGCAYAHDTT